MHGLLRRHGIWLLPLIIFVAAGIHEAFHASIGYRLGAQPAYGYTLRGQPVNFLGILARSLPSWIVMGLLAAVAARLAKALPLLRSTWKRTLPLHFGASFVFAAACLLIIAAIRYTFFVGPETGVSFRLHLLRYYAVYYNMMFTYYWASVGAYSAYSYYRALREREVLAERLAHSLTEARLEMLQAKLQPHFLFNTLNLIAALASEGDRLRTSRTISQLSELLRLSLARTGSVVTMAEELDALELYASIQRSRFEDRLAIELDYDAQCLDAEVPTFLLQPLVENAIRHGVAAGGASRGHVRVRCARAGAELVVTVEDNGPGFAASPPAFGAGLRNVTERLRQLYGEDGSVRFSPPGRLGGHVTVTWPFRRLSRPGDLADPAAAQALAVGYQAARPRPAAPGLSNTCR